MNQRDLLSNHGRVISYLKGVSEAIVRTTETIPEGIPAEMGAEVQEQARKYARLFDLAAELLSEDAVIMTVLVTAGSIEKAEEPEARLTTVKVAQA